MKLHKKNALSVLGLAAAFLGAVLINSPSVFAAHVMGFSPQRTNKVLVPGSTDIVTVTLYSPANAEEPTDYELDFRPYYNDDDGGSRLEAKGSYSEMVDWISYNEDDMKGTIEPNESKPVSFTINVPKDAPAGGQYAALVISTRDDDQTKSSIKQVYEMVHVIYAEVAGETIRQGEVLSVDVPSFLFSGDYTAGATIKNQGNVHAKSKHTLKVYPLFGNEEIYIGKNNTEDDSAVDLILPDATRYTSITWDQTPSVGIFKVNYTVEFEGVTNEVEKIVIICPLWLLVIILLLIVTIAYRLITNPKRKKAKKDKTEDAAEV